MVTAAGVIEQQHGRSVVDGNQYIHGAIVVKVADGEPAGGEVFGKDGSALRTDIDPFRAAVAKQQQRFRIPHLGETLLHHSIRMPVAGDQVKLAVIVVIKEAASPSAE